SNLRQWASSDLTADGGLTLLPQAASIDNVGRARATTGRNQATGNSVEDAPLGGQAVVNQFLPAEGNGAIDLGVESNQAVASNQSDGRATIDTGDAFAAGNRSMSDLSQSSTANDSTLNIYPQVATIQNHGRAVAGTGRNEATGSDGNNPAVLDQ